MNNLEELENLEDDQRQKISNQVLEHMMDPKNYGTLEDATCTGVGLDASTGEYAMMYLKIANDKNNQEIIEDVKFGANACQDTIVAGSLFTQMIKGATLEYATDASKRLEKKIENVPPKQQACSLMIIRSFEASLLHKKEKSNGSLDDLVTLEIGLSCEGIDEKEQQK
jgi:nitrogen fixation NifU-like protein